MSGFPEDYCNLKEGKRLDSASSLIKLTLFIDRQGILWVRGRIENAPVPPEVRHPIILPADEKITELLIYSLHLKFAHSIRERTFREVRKLYGDQRGQKKARRIINKCFKCKRHYAKAALPGYRLYTYRSRCCWPYNVTKFRWKVKRWASFLPVCHQEPSWKCHTLLTLLHSLIASVVSNIAVQHPNLISMIMAPTL